MDQYKRSGLFDKVRKEVVSKLLANESFREQVFADCKPMIEKVLETKNPTNATIAEANQKLKQQMVLHPVRRNNSIVVEVEENVGCTLDAFAHINDVERLVRKTMGVPEKQVAVSPPPPPPPPALPPLVPSEVAIECAPPPPPPPPPKIEFDDEPCCSRSLPVEHFDSVENTIDSQEEVLMEVSDGDSDVDKTTHVSGSEQDFEEVTESKPVVETVPESKPVKVSFHCVSVTESLQEEAPVAAFSGRSRRQPKRKNDDTYLYY
uniref:Uncharacterized protein n=1 Tax=Steinernema glaseri TaxID=37863 RepID=A0A1I7ZLL1_9BILA